MRVRENYIEEDWHGWAYSINQRIRCDVVIAGQFRQGETVAPVIRGTRPRLRRHDVLRDQTILPIQFKVLTSIGTERGLSKGAQTKSLKGNEAEKAGKGKLTGGLHEQKRTDERKSKLFFQKQRTDILRKTNRKEKKKIRKGKKEKKKKEKREREDTTGRESA